MTSVRCGIITVGKLAQAVRATKFQQGENFAYFSRFYKIGWKQQYEMTSSCIKNYRKFRHLFHFNTDNFGRN